MTDKAFYQMSLKTAEQSSDTLQPSKHTSIHKKIDINEFSF